MQTKLGDGSIAICGVLPKDAEFKTVGDKNSSLTKFSVKVDERKVEGQDKPDAIWCNCVCWHDTARASQDYKKMDVVFAIGRLQTREYEKDDETKKVTELVCEFVAKMGKQEPATPIMVPTSQPSYSSNGFETIESDDDLPF